MSQPKYSLQVYRDLFNLIHEECAVDGQFLGADIVNETGKTPLYETALIILDALQHAAGGIDS